MMCILGFQYAENVISYNNVKVFVDYTSEAVLQFSYLELERIISIF